MKAEKMLPPGKLVELLMGDLEQISYQGEKPIQMVEVIALKTGSLVIAPNRVQKIWVIPEPDFSTHEKAWKEHINLGNFPTTYYIHPEVEWIATVYNQSSGRIELLASALGQGWVLVVGATDHPNAL